MVVVVCVCIVFFFFPCETIGSDTTNGPLMRMVMSLD